MSTLLRPKLYVTDVEALTRFQNKYGPNARQGFQKVRKCAPVDKPETVTPEKLPDPWLADSEWLLGELAKIRQDVLRIPVRLDNASDINAVLDRCWHLEGNLRFLLFLYRDGQRAFAKKVAAAEEKARKQVEAADLLTGKRSVPH
jgi:hypothetical protein